MDAKDTYLCCFEVLIVVTDLKKAAYEPHELADIHVFVDCCLRSHEVGQHQEETASF